MKIVCLSGGLDSAVSLAYAVKHRAPDEPLVAIRFYYGQRNYTELDYAEKIANDFGIELLSADLSGAFAESGLAHGSPIAPDTVASAFVPGRNAAFITMAAVNACRWHKEHTGSLPDRLEVVIGVYEDGYPDCSTKFLVMQENALEAALGFPVSCFSPVLYRGKVETIRLAQTLGVWDKLGSTWSCYEAGEKPCGKCPACELRSRAFQEAGVIDPSEV